MKKISIGMVALIALSIAGCGPSAEQKKMVTDMTGEVTTMVNDASSSLGKIDDAVKQVDAAIITGDSLKMKAPKDSTSIGNAIIQLKTAKDRLLSVKDNVSQWVAAYKTPDLEKAKFEQVVADLKKNKDEVTSASAEIQGAIDAAMTALEEYRNVASSVKVTKK